MRQLFAGLAGAAFLSWGGAALAQTSGCATPGSHYDVYGNPCMGLDSAGGGGGGGGAVTGAANSFVDGWNITLGTKADGAWNGVTGSASEIAIDKAIYGALAGTLAISAASLPLPSGAATATGLSTINTTLGSPFQAGGSIGNTSFGISGSLPAGTNAIGSVTALAPATIPAAGAASTIATGGSANALISGTVNGCYITNPLTASDQNIATAEVAYVNPVTTATANGRGSNSALQPGQTWTCVPGMTTGVSAIAATSGHAFNVVKW